jgi:hypothetical protein
MANAEPYELKARERRLQIFEERERTDIRLRKLFAIVLGVVFVLLNLFACYLIWTALSLDQALLKQAASYKGELRVTSNVFIALLSATAAQVGAALVVVAKYLFPGKDA